MFIYKFRFDFVRWIRTAFVGSRLCFLGTRQLANHRSLTASLLISLMRISSLQLESTSWAKTLNIEIRTIGFSCGIRLVRKNIDLWFGVIFGELMLASLSMTARVAITSFRYQHICQPAWMAGYVWVSGQSPGTSSNRRKQVRPRISSWEFRKNKASTKRRFVTVERDSLVYGFGKARYCFDKQRH